MNSTLNQTKIENWLGNKNIFEIIKDRHRIDTIVQDIHNQDGHVNIEILQFANIFSLYQNLDKQRQVVVKRISQTDDWGLRLKIGEELIAIENEEKQFLKNVLYTAHTFTNIKLQGTIENVAESFFTGNIEKANELLNPTQLETEQNKVLQLIQAQTKLEQAYDSLEDNANEFRVKAQLTVLNLNIVDADDRFEKAVFYFERGQVSVKTTDRKPLIADYSFKYAFFLQENNQFSKAFPLLKESIVIFKTLSESNPTTYLPLVAGNLNNLGAILYSKNEFDLAIKNFKEGFLIFEKSSITVKRDLPYLLEIVNNLALIYNKKNKFKISESYYEKALKIVQKLDVSNLKVLPIIFSLYVNIGTLQKQQNKFDEAEESYKNALKIVTELEETTGEFYFDLRGTIFNNLGIIYDLRGDFSQALLFYNEALSIRKELSSINPQKYLPVLASTFNNIGIMYQENNKYGKATKMYDEALLIRRQLGIKNEEAYLYYIGQTLNNLGLLQKKMSAYDDSEKTLREALENRRRLMKFNADVYLPEMASTLDNLGILLMRKGIFDEAQIILEETLEIRVILAENNPDVYLPVLAISLTSLANLYYKIGNLNDAEKNYKETLSIRKKLAEQNPDVFKYYQAETLYNLGHLFHSKKDFVSAETYYMESYILHKEVNLRYSKSRNSRDLAGVMSNIAILNIECENFEKAEKFYNEALKTHQELVKSNKNSHLLLGLIQTQLNIALFYQKNIPNQELSIQLTGEAITNCRFISSKYNVQNHFDTATLILEKWGIRNYTFW